MRFEEVVFERVGAWSDLPPLLFGPRLTLVLGDNEAGKSTSMRAIEAMLFGPTRELIAPLQSESHFKASARVRLMDGSELGWKRVGKTVEPEASAVSLATLAPADERGTFHDLFRLGHDQVRGAKGFLSDEGALGRVLFAAETGGSAGALAKTEESLGERIKAGMSRGAKTRGLGRLAQELKDLKNEQRSGDRFAEYDDVQTKIEGLSDLIASLEDEERTTRARKAKLAAYREGLPESSQRQSAKERLAQLEADGPVAPARWEADIRAAVDAWNRGLTDHTARVQTLEQAKTLVAALPPVPLIRAYAEEVKQLELRVGNIKSETVQLEKVRGALAETRQSLRRLLDSVFELEADDDTVLEKARALLVSQAKRTTFKRLIEEGASATQQLEQSKSAQGRAERKRDAARQAANEAPQFSVGELERAVELVEHLKSLDSEIESWRNQASQSREKALVLARTLQLSDVDESALANLAVPSAERVEDAWAALDAARQALNKAGDALASAKVAELDARNGHRALADGQEEPVSREALVEARQARESAWIALKEAWTSSVNEAALPALSAVVESRVSEADGVADRRFEDATRIEKFGAAKRALDSASEEVARLGREQAAAETTHAEAAADWNALWPFLSEAPRKPELWLSEYQALVGALEDARRSNDSQDAKTLKRRAVRADLAVVLDPVLPSASSLDTAIALLPAINQERTRREALNDEANEKRAILKTLEAQALEAARSHEAASEACDAWRVEWNAAASDLPQTVKPELALVRDWLEQQEKLGNLCASAVAQQADIETKTRAVEAFEEQVTRLLERLREADPHLAVPDALSPVAALLELSRLSEEARVIFERREKEEQTLENAETEERKAAAAVKLRHESVSDLWTTAGFPNEWTREDIDAEVARAIEAAALQTTISDCERGLRVRWKEDVDEALATIGERDEVNLEREEQEADEALVGLSQRRDRAVEERKVLDGKRDALEVRPEAELDQEYADATELLVDKANELAVLNAAQWLLRKARERATSDAAPLVDVASKNFALLTGGEYQGLSLDRSVGKDPVLWAESTAGDQKKADELSDGTLDQLWLALRLAVIEREAERTHWPLVLDDVFVHFDDQRTTAALKLLERLSEKVQVILFTHHDHVVDLAKRAVSESLSVQILARPVHHERLLPEERERHERPEAPTAHAPEAKASKASGGGDVYEQVLEVLADATQPLSRSDIFEAVESAFGTSVETGAWNKAITQLRDEARVVQTGQKRGAKYRLASSDDFAVG